MPLTTKLAPLMIALVSFGVAAPALSLTIDFEGFAHGDEVTSSQGVTIVTTNSNKAWDQGVAFDTNQPGTADEDLQFLSPGIAGGENGWTMGNLSRDTDLGNVLIIQENLCGNPCLDPDDEGRRPAGSFDFDFSSLGSFSEFSMDLVDVESSTAEPGSVVFYHFGTEVASVGFMDFLSDPTVVYGNNSANHVDVLSGIYFDQVVIHMGGSGAVDNITAGVPEPSAALLFAIGASIFGARFRRI